MAIQDDFQVAVNGDIRYTGSGANYTVIAFHRWLGDLMDDAQASGNDILDITDATASERSTDNIITLLPPYNINDTAAQHLYDGSIIQSNGDTIYDGVLVFAPAGTPLQIIQNGKPAYPNFWGAGINADAANGISHRFMLKVRSAAADIDGRRLVGQTREVGKTYSEFPINGTARGNNVLALVYANDLNNATAIATIAGWTTVTAVEGYQLIDVNNDAATEPYCVQWDRGSQSINQFFERHKWLTRESTKETDCNDTGSSFQLGNATIIGQSQSFANGVNAQFCTRARFSLRKVGSPTGAITCKLYAHSGTFGSSSIPTGAALATSVTLEAALLTTSYLEYEFAFLTQALMAASTNYTITVEHAVIDGANYIEVEGLATSGTHAGNRAQLVTATWTATAGDDLKVEVYASPQVFELPGEVFRGVTHEVTVDTPTGTFQAVEPLSWSGGTGQLLAINSPTAATKLWMQLLTGVAPTDNQVITGGQSAATCAVNVTVTTRTVSAPTVGASTGSAIIGAYGLGIQVADLTAADKLTDLNATLRIPPNNVQFVVGGLVSGEDRVLVAPLGYSFAYDNEASGPFQKGETLTFTSPAGTAYLSELTDDGTTGRMKIRMLTGSVPANNSPISGGTSSATADVNGAVVAAEDPRQLKLATTLSGATETAVVVTAAIPTDTPNTGTIRIQLNTGIYRRVAYTSYTGSTFTIASTDFSGANTATGGASEAGNSVFISYIDKLADATTASFTGVYLADRSLFVRVRDGGTAGDAIAIKTFETTGTLGSAGGSATAIRTSDA